MTAADFVQYGVSGITIGAIYAIVALSFTIVFNTTGIVNFAQGEYVILAGLGATTLVALGLPLWFAALLTLPALALVAMAVYFVTIVPIQKKPVLTAMLVTLGTALTLQALMVIFWGAEPKRLAPLLPGDSVSFLGAAVTPQSLAVLVGTAALMIGLLAFFKFTRAGQAMLACSDNREGAGLVGIDVRKVSLGAFMLAGALAAFAGVMVTPITSAVPSDSLMLTLKGFAAAVLGGLGRPGGAVAGGLLLGLVQSYGAGLWESGYQDAIALSVLLIVLIVRPSGLFGSRALAAR